ncbi:type II secretion system minor pseudopilin GspK [Abyssibacter profundi]|uniref:Type II secretion system protein K n=1 Tax=Abyssibacter profundi TaxID=2182787 RepID=A0A363UNA0_9GAMM|nr:type II secretion system minor pseudopilin GspK [Abyssibacter profundi]MBV61140.1 general secretion pathway protein GspK [Nevskiales bacterium]PWN56883.1 general secretion pathway protein GspK [Abyssibacter profundi]
MKRSQQGVAVLTAIFVMALASIAAASLAYRQNIAFHRTEALKHSEQAWWVARGVADWATTLLEKDREQGEVDHLGEFWATPVDYLPVDNGVVTGGMVDLQGRFNLNNLASTDPIYSEIFQRLILGLSLESGSPTPDPEQLVAAIQDWIDPDVEPRFPGGAEDGIYLSKTPPYRAANRPFASVSELRLVDGVTPALYAALEPLVTALPEETTININTAPPALLLALSANPSPGDIAAFVENRAEQPAESLDPITNDALLGPAVDRQGLSVSSRYFLVHGEATIGRGRVRLYSLIFRSAQGQARVVYQSRDTF